MSQVINKIVANAPKAVVTAEPLAEVIRPLAVLEREFTFEGESIASVGKVSLEESVRLSVSLVNSGEQSKARGVYVAAHKLATLTEAKDVKAFKDSLCAEFVMEAKTKAIELAAGKLSEKALEMAKEKAGEDAKKRYGNICQAIRAAVWAVNNPNKLADGVSVFTLTQANKYLEAPKDDADDKEEIEAVRNVVLPLLKKSTATQAAVKDAINKAKEEHAAKVAKAAEVTLTPEQKAKKDAEHKSAELMKRRSYLASKIIGCVEEWGALVTDLTASGESAEQAVRSLRDHSNVHGDASKGTMKSTIATLARLAGLEIKQP